MNIDDELDYLDEQLADDRITRGEHTAEVRELMRDYQAAADEAAQDAYDRERERW